MPILYECLLLSREMKKGYEFLGEQEVKNIAKPVGAYLVVMEPRVTVADLKGKKQTFPFWRRKGSIFAAIGYLLLSLV